MFDDILKKITYGLYVVTTTKDEGEEIRKVGCTVNTCMQITIDPATVAISINKEHCTARAVKQSGKFGVSIMSEETPLIIIGTFGYFSSEEKDKFEEIEYETVEGIPVIKGSLGYLVCEVINTIENDTHNIFVGRIISGKVYSEAEPLTYAKYHKILGK